MSNAVSTTWPSGSTNAGWPQEPTGMLMPGRIQGWPAGTQRASSPATTLLSQAVAWWDVEQYRDGDRFLRNQGVAGELLNLRLGSSIVANTNDPLYLPVDPQGSGYVYLSGVAGNSLSMTAPATATNYIAYPLDRSTSTSTGSVTGGATFTFSTTGSWLKIELLDASNVVLDTIDCDAITSGSNTSFASALNQTVTVNRSTSGRKSVAVPSRHKGGRPVMLLGTDDFLEIPAENGWQHGLLNFGQGQSFSLVAVIRQWGTPTSSGVYLAKMNTTPMWKLTSNGTSIQGRLFVHDGTTQIDTAVGAAALTAGTLNTLVANIDRSAQVATIYQNATAGTGRSILSVASLNNATPVSVGRQTASTYQDFELYGVAIFRRSLSPADIKTISDYFAGRIA